uniref:ABC transporter G family member 23 n=1 Tax=Cacopsylla melanoneura TaxID=428564 RepID=A0A8D8V747_9HEMI
MRKISIKKIDSESNIIKYSVEVTGAKKKIGNHEVLKGLNLRVPEKKIYGLLGPSGCGKTTLLNCIVGRNYLEKGSIKLTYNHIREIGYMPQELALIPELSIRETFLYFGKIFSMSNDQIERRSKEILDLLQLPRPNEIVGALSGGQQRRISFAVTLLHDPKLLILDEPTVGLDPILSQIIWERLKEMAFSGKTIIITTHYIEEAKGAHMIGLMRDGALLAEQSPSSLLASHNCNYLEDAFLELCIQQQNSDETRKNEEKENRRMSSIKAPPVTLLESQQVPIDVGKLSMARFKAQLLKNLYLLKRNLVFTLFLVFLPVIQVSTFNIACGHDPKQLSLAVVNRELLSGISSCSPDFVHSCFLDHNETQYMSCRLLDKLRAKTFNILEYPDMESGKLAVIKNTAWGLLYFSENYTISLAERVNQGQNVNDGTVETGLIDTWMDMSNQYIGRLVQHDIVESLVEALEDAMELCQLNKKLANIPLQLEDAIYGNNHPAFIHYAAPAILCLCAFYLPAIYTGAAILSEKEGGLIERIMICGMKFIEIATAHLFVQFVFLGMQTIMLMVVMYIIFDNPYLGDTLTTFSLIFLIGIDGMFFGFLIALLSKSQTEAAYFGIGSNFLLKFLCGLLWPTEGIHIILRTLSLFLPLTMATEALRSLTTRGWTITHPVVFSGFASTIAWIAVFCVLSFIVLKTKKDIWSTK